MNILTAHYGSGDSRSIAARVLDSVLGFAIENLSDGHGGAIYLLPANNLQDVTAIYRSECGAVMISQLNDHCDDDDIPGTVDFTAEEFGKVLEFMKRGGPR